MDRIIEAYVGEYASGKSEIAINRALELHDQGRSVRLVDLDLVEPFYTLRPVKKELEERGIEVIAWETGELVGLGEIGLLLKPETRWAVAGAADVIFDVGYGVRGVQALNLVEGALKRRELQVIAVVNIARPLTGSIEDISAFVNSLEKVDALVNNSHLGTETDIDIIQEGARIVTRAAKSLGLPVIATTVAREHAAEIGRKDCMDNPVKVLDLFMTNAYW